MKAIILAGGFGTRLRTITGDQIPKCMVRGCWTFGTRDLPWIEVVIRTLHNQGIKNITLALHYKAEVFTNWFCGQAKYKDLKFKIEDEPLGTGGAIKNCIEDDEPTLVINGDTIANINYADMLEKHCRQITMAVDKSGKSAGIYIIDPKLFKKFSKKAFSFERDVIPHVTFSHYPVKWFTDMGTPEGYAEAQDGAA